MFLKILYEGRVIKQNFSDDTSLLELHQFVAKSFSLHGYQYKLLKGNTRPPTQLPTNVPLSTTLKEIGILNSSSLIVSKNTSKDEVIAMLLLMGFSIETCIQAVAVAPDADIEVLVDVCSEIDSNQGGGDCGKIEREVIDADNSCLFNAIGFLVGRVDPMYYRKIIAETISSDPIMYSVDFLGKDPNEYISWILNLEKWGGEIEMSILSQRIGVQIAAIDIQTCNFFIYGQDSANGDSKRIYLLYDGIHYDAITLRGGVSNADVTLQFQSSSTDVEEKVRKFAEGLKSQRKFVNLAGCSLQCNVCGAGLKGSAEAQEHAKATGHQNFGQVGS
jgi:ubiquitin thioesterase OTU1